MPYKNFLKNESIKKEPGGIENDVPWEWWHIGMVRNAKEENLRKVKVYLKPSPYTILDQNVPLRGWYKSKFEVKGTRARPCYTEALLTSPYGGSCPIKCQFCYVNNGVRGYRGQGLTTVDPNYPNKIGQQLDKMCFGWNGYISSFTEPFQPIEKIFHNTERLSEEFTKRGLPIFYLTRQIPPEWTIKQLLLSKYSYQQFSIITSNEDTYKKLSPGAAPLNDILNFIMNELSPRGIYTSIQINPLLPGIVSLDDIIELITRLKECGANHVIFKFVEIFSSAAKQMIAKMYQLFGPEKGFEFESNFCEITGGVKTIKQSLRIRWLENFKALTKKLDMTMGLCYEYDHTTEQSIGPYFCTADQCHGMRVPIHIKNDKGIFEPWEGCPPSGCLYCKESNINSTNTIPCKSSFLQESHALEPKHYQINFWE